MRRFKRFKATTRFLGLFVHTSFRHGIDSGRFAVVQLGLPLYAGLDDRDVRVFRSRQPLEGRYEWLKVAPIGSRDHSDVTGNLTLGNSHGRRRDTDCATAVDVSTLMLVRSGCYCYIVLQL